jgi:hypothetical protein
MTTSKRIIGPFTTKYGQTLHPGDRVATATVCAGQTRVERGVYVGYIEHPGRSWDPVNKVYEPHIVKYAQVEKTYSKSHSVYKETGLPVNWSTWAPNSGVELVHIRTPYTRVTTLQDNRIILEESLPTMVFELFR